MTPPLLLISAAPGQEGPGMSQELAWATEKGDSMGARSFLGLTSSSVLPQCPSLQLKAKKGKAGEGRGGRGEKMQERKGMGR